MTPAPLRALQSLAQQANAEGITWVASAGDDGAAMCDTTAATHGAAVSVIAALPEVTGVGGTMFTGEQQQLLELPEQRQRFLGAVLYSGDGVE